MLTEYNNDPDLWENEVHVKIVHPRLFPQRPLSATTPHPHHRVTAFATSANHRSSRFSFRYISNNHTKGLIGGRKVDVRFRGRGQYSSNADVVGFAFSATAVAHHGSHKLNTLSFDSCARRERR